MNKKLNTETTADDLLMLPDIDGIVTPKIEVKADMQRYNTIEVMNNQRDIVYPTFKFICDHIFKDNE